MAKIWYGSGNALRVVSFIELGDTENELIETMVEYWGEIGEPPKWRRELGIGKRYSDGKFY